MGSLFSHVRVAQRNKDNSGFSFDLPKEVLEEREKAWGNLFERYANKGSDDIELNIDTMEPVIKGKNADDNDDDDDDDDEEDEVDDDEDQEKQYFSKCRAPMRKLPALIQYWIDTGNPPYQLIGEEDHSETGSSLSEGEHSRTGHSAVLRESIDNRKFDDNSACSSVDTAAYILSNVNVTKKSETMAIVEGAKTPDETISPNVVSPLNKKTYVSPTVIESTLSMNLNVSSSQRSSVMLSQVIPEIQQFDEILEKSSSLKPARSELSKFRRKGKPMVILTRPKNHDIFQTNHAHGVSKSSEDSSLNVDGKTCNRRKLYTGRNSPIDLIVTRHSNESTVLTGQSSHPALEPVETLKKRVTSFASRARARRKRKRETQRESEIIKDNGNISPESEKLVQDDGNNNNNNSSGNNENTKKKDDDKEGDERYTDFFESLGLTPSKTLMEKPKNVETSPKREARKKKGKKSNKRNKNENCRVKSRESMKSLEKQSDILIDKILRIRVERLSNDVLSRYERQKSATDSANSTSLVNQSLNKNENVELLTTMTHDSDSSTILICSCNQANTAPSSESECSLFTKIPILPTNAKTNKFSTTKLIDTTKKRDTTKLRSNKSILNSSMIDSTNKLTDNIGKLLDSRNLFVKLEKLPIYEHSRKTELAPTGVTDIKSSSQDLKGKFLKISLSTEINDLFDLSGETRENVNKRVTIGSRGFGKTSNKLQTREKKEDTRIFGCMELSRDEDEEANFARIVGDFGSKRIVKNDEQKINKNEEEMEKISRPMTRSRDVLKIVEYSEDEDDDNFAKIMDEIGSRKIVKNGRKKMNETGKIIKDEDQMEKIPRPITRSRSILGIVESSDEEEQNVKFSRETRQKRRGEITSSKVVKMTEKRTKNLGKTIDELLKDLTNEDDDNAINRSENRLDESAGGSSFGNSMKNNGIRERLRGKKLSSTANDIVSTKNPSNELDNRKNFVDNRIEASFTDLINVMPESRRGQKRRQISQRTSDKKRARFVNSASFKTRLNSDTDSEIEKRKFSTMIEDSTKREEPVIKESLTIDNSTKLIDKRERTNVEEKNSSFSRTNVTNEADKRLNGEAMKTLEIGEIEKKNLQEKTNNSQTRQRKNGKMVNRKVGRKKVRRTRILGTPMEYESDDNIDNEQSRKNLTENMRKNENLPNNSRFIDTIVKNNEKDNNSWPKKLRNRSKNLFSDISDDAIADIDIIFDRNSRVTRSSGLLEILNLDTPKIQKNFANSRKSTITFRTRLANDSDDEIGS